ncbi:MAG: NAD(P)/FAD-dependent oxidoreductase [Pseudomonadota bacterium]
MAEYQVEAVVIGGGVVGLACARELAQRGIETVLLEAADTIGSETSSRNSEVIHAGIYYPPGSAKAALCVRGKGLLYEYLQSHGISHRRCGKLIVATRAEELSRLREIQDRALAAGVPDLEPLDQALVARLEPAVRAVAGVLSPSTGILDSHQFMLQLQADIEALGGTVLLRHQVTGGRLQDGQLRLRLAPELELGCRYLINATGNAARAVLASLLGAGAELPEQHYAVGHYYSYSGGSPFRRLVYPVPVAGGLGIHATLDLAGQVRFGPDVRWRSAVDYTFDDSERPAFAAAIERYFPAVESRRLQPAYTGVRPKLLGPGAGDTDFLLLDEASHGYAGLLSLHGIESPGLTASLAIAEQVCDRLLGSQGRSGAKTVSPGGDASAAGLRSEVPGPE